MFSFRSFALTLLLFSPLLVGCGPATSTISGTVSVDGKPLEKGTLACVSADGKSETVSVVAGAYQVKTTPGKKVFQISAPVVVGTRKEHNGPGAADVEITNESLAARYNSQSELNFEAKSGSNTKNWDLTSSK